MKKRPALFCSKGAAAIVVLLGLLLPAKSFAQCEQAPTATAAMTQLMTTDLKNITDYTAQEINMVIEKLSNTAANEMKARLDELDANVREALTAWSDRLIPTMKKMTAQLSVAQVEQTRAIGSMMDAKLLNEAIRNRKEQINAAQKRYVPSELSCQTDTAGPGQIKAYQMSRALARGFAHDASPRISNAKNTASANGTIAEMKSLWDEYVTKFCDPAKGDQGCPAPGTLAGKNRDIPAMLWGNRQTIDMSNPDNRLMVDASLRYLIRPMSEDPIPADAVDSLTGREALLARRAEAARLNSVYNVLGQMIAARAGGSGVNTQAIRLEAGVPATEASVDSSYREAVQAMTKERFYDPMYVVHAVVDFLQIGREEIMVNAARLNVMSDIYRRSEELLFMEAAAYSRDLDKQMPGTANTSAPVK